MTIFTNHENIQDKNILSSKYSIV